MPKKPEVPIAVEVFITIRELSKPRSNMFRWYQLRDAYAAISPPSWRGQQRSGWKMSLGNIIRALLWNGLVVKVDKGLYRITRYGMSSNLKGVKMYVSPGEVRRRFVADFHDAAGMAQIRRMIKEGLNLDNL